ncbi:MAG: hypothetical protein FWC83_02215 [Alphaproteobacteria bacterium]|nr:hypothetical protein [Alphaproteobacteria bacterium]
MNWEKIYKENKSGRRVFEHIVGDEKFYVKRRTKKLKYFERLLPKIIYFLTGSILVAPPKFDTENNFEIQRLEQLRRAKINAPKVVYTGKDFFVMSDVGDQIGKFIRTNPGKEEEYIIKTVKQLAKMHNAGIIHGGAQVRNYCTKGGKIYTIDVEEDYDDKHIDKMKKRDIVLFLYSVQRRFPTTDVKKIADAYHKETGFNISSYMQKLAGRFRFALFFEKLLPKKRQFQGAFELIRNFL